jgi:hypothetical protein
MPNTRFNRFAQFIATCRGGDAAPLGGEADKVGAFSLHAGVAAEAHESQKLERLCRFITCLSSGRDSPQPQAHQCPYMDPIPRAP